MSEAQSTIAICKRDPADDDAIRAVVTAAFHGPDEAALIEALRQDGDMTVEFVARDKGEVVGHIAFSRLAVRAGSEALRATALAPLAVAPLRQHQGIGDALTRCAIRHLRDEGHDLIVVLGHPAYYARFGFSSIVAKLLDAPFSGDSFMALELKPAVLGALRWRVTYAKVFATPH